MEVIKNSDYELVTLGANTKLPQLDEISDGDIIVIRYIRSKRLLDILGEKFKASKDLVCL